MSSSPAPVVHLKRLRAGAVAPRSMTEGAAGMDLAAALDEPVTLQPRERRLVPTGWAMAIQPGYEGQVRPRSGLALKTGVTVLNAPGTIDADYRGEVMVLLVNTGEAPVVIEPGMRIAQLVIARALRADVSEVNDLPDTARGEGGFGSTGRGG
ncbi:MAG TPA: dUTP diphosphatase [Kofleriaceae bacterium]|nr:dUTP diphosphatase [Kofleriaceae bacterium]